MPQETERNRWELVESAFLVYVNSEEEDDAIVEAELEGLCEAAHISPVGNMRQRLDRPHKGHYLGTGKVEELKAYVADTNCDVVIVDAELSGMQARNLAEALERKVVDRTQLILDIFARRAHTREGKLQVELAQLSYLMPRLMSQYTKFERQRGGIGMRGPGEMKLEADKRLTRDRIARLNEEIEDVRAHRQHQRQARRRFPFPFATIVGYTSAGKSTLMNRLAGTDLLADAMPFATLDPTTKKIDLPEGYALFLTDTVGFIRNLPTHLVASFRATLEEVAFSDFVIHVVDVSHEYWEDQVNAVLETVESLGASDKPTLTVFNKIDRLASHELLRTLVAEFPNSVAISATEGIGMDELQRKIKEMVQAHLGRIRALVPFSEAALVERCYDYGRVLVKDYREDGIYLEAEVVPEMERVLKPYILAE